MTELLSADGRRLMAALSDPITRSLIDLLRSAPKSEGELAKELQVSRGTVRERLRTLEGFGLAEFGRRPTGGRGRPANDWAAMPQAIAACDAFCAQANALVLELLQRRSDRQAAAVTAHRSAMIHLVEEDRSARG
jgi:predicted ArsR family transcriptional regulator